MAARLVGLALAWTVLVAPVQAAEPPLVTEAIVNAPVDKVWEGFATPAGYASVGAQAVVDLRIGGSLEVRSDPRAVATVNEILSYEPGRLLAIRVKQPPAASAPAAAFANTWTLVYLTPLGDMTHVRVAGFGFTTPELARFFAEDQSAQLRRLEKLHWPLCELCKAEGK